MKRLFSYSSFGSMVMLQLLLPLHLAAQQESPPSLNRGPVFMAGGNLGLGIAPGPFSVFDGPGECGTFDGREESGFAISGRVLFPALLTTRIGGGIGLQIQREDQSSEAIPLDPQRVVDHLTGEKVELDRRYRFESSATLFYITPFLSLQPTRHLRLQLGATVGYRAVQEVKEEEVILAPESFLYENGERKRDLVSGRTFRGRGIATGADIRIAYDLPLGSGFGLTPELGFHVDPVGPVGNEPRPVYSIHPGLQLRYQKQKKEPEESIPPVPPSDPVAAAPPIPEQHPDREGPLPLTVSLELHVQDRPGQNQLSRKDSVIIPISLIREERVVLLGSEDRDGRSIPVNLLQQIGSDLLADQNATVIFRNRTKEALPSSSWQDEAADFLKERIGIDGNQIIRERRDLDARFELIRQDHSWIALERRRASVTSFNPPQLRLLPRIDGGTPPFRWNISLQYDGKELARYSSDAGERAKENQGMVWNRNLQLSTDRSGSTPYLTGIMLVVDRNGIEGRGVDSLPLRFIDESAIGPAGRFVLDGGDVPIEAIEGEILLEMVQAFVRTEGATSGILHYNRELEEVATRLLDGLREGGVVMEGEEEKEGGILVELPPIDR